MNEETIIGYGVFEELNGDISVCYYTDDDDSLDIDEDNFYETELDACQMALAVANVKIKDRKLVSYNE